MRYKVSRKGYKSKIGTALKDKFGEDYFIKIGRRGGQISRGGGFEDRELASRAGKIGGKVSKRPKQTLDRLDRLGHF